MKKINVSLIALAIIMIGATYFSVIAHAGQVTGFNTYKSCVDDSECGDDGYCVNGKCIESKEKKGCVDDSECGDNSYCDNGECIKSKEKKGCVDDSECGEGGYCVGGECKETKKW
jgi:hypothetical protein